MNDLSDWLKKQPKWMQEAAGLLVKKGSLEDAEISTLLDKCLQEVDTKCPPTVVSFPADVSAPQHTPALRLCTISNVKGINALAPKNPLDFKFPNNLVVVYGTNGSGKSGYVRILKHISGTRNPGKLYPDVFADGGSTQSADISYSIDKPERPVSVSWSASDGALPDLRPVDIFDADRGRMYVESESEVTYEPPELLFFSDLISVCKQIEQRIDGKLESCASSKTPKMPSEYSDTQIAKWYTSLSQATLPDDVAMHVKWEAEDDAVVTSLEKRLAEKAPADRAKESLTKKEYAERLIQSIEGFLLQLGDENCRRILNLKTEKLAKSNAAQATATGVLSSDSLDGIGTDAWKSLWEHARRYSEGHAYLGHAFPNIDPNAKCVLCHQPLSDEARKRFSSFDAFIKGQAEKDAIDAARALEDAMNSIGDIPGEQMIRTQCDAGEMTSSVDTSLITTFADALRQRKEKLLDVEDTDELPPIPDCTEWLQKAKKQVSEHTETAQAYQKDAESDNRPQLQIQLRELRARKWVFEQCNAIKEEIERLRAKDRLNKAKDLTNTRNLSLKKGEIAETMITESFVRRFQYELAALGASRIKVTLVKKRVSHGQVLHELRLVNARFGAPRDVLSEGEHRIVSLAAFLADVTGKAQSTPIVFDDPISSLDQDFEDIVAQRLVRLSNDRQVIVFTHRTSLLVYLKEYGQREKLEPNIICIKRECWGAGDPSDIPLSVQKTSSLLNTLLKDRLAKAQNVLAHEGLDAYAPHAEAICRNFRVLLESVIEYDLLADVVQRFRRAVQTKGKLHKLARITKEDCEFFNEMMTKYSRYEHSQPIEAPVPLPMPDELKMDLEALRDRLTELSTRENP